MMKNQTYITSALLLLGLSAVASAEPVSLAGPSGAVRMVVASYGGERLGYKVTLRGRPVVEWSALGMTLDGVNIAEGIKLGKPRSYSAEETFSWNGVHSPAANRFKGFRFPVHHGKTSLSYTLELRVYDDGVAFRFVVPGRPGETRVPDEATYFRIPEGSTVWFHDFRGHYETYHARKAIAEVAAGEWAALPLTFKLPAGAGYASITEGALLRYSGLGLQGDGRGSFVARLGHVHPISYPFRLRYERDIPRVTRPAAVEGEIVTPWRIVMAVPDLNALVNCDIVSAVAPPPDPRLFPDGARTGWIRPGRSVWRYLDGGDSSLEGMKEFSRLASELGFEYNLLEGFWARWPMEQLQELARYSRKLGVGLWLWKHSRDLRTPEARKEFFRTCNEAGAVGAKIDFFDHEAKEIVELYEILLHEAAEHKILVNFHGANKPTGEARTYPNELTREAVRGMEGRSRERARHNVTLPFTRMLAGHADYTPVHFGERRGDTTWTHQVATAAVFTSPLLVYGAHPARLLANPAVEIIKSIPSVWDETIVLPFSEIGEVAGLARRRGDMWIVAVLNGTEARKVTIPLSFLGAGSYRALLAKDGDAGDGSSIQMEEASFSRSDAIPLELRPGGGFIARLSRLH